MEEGSGEMLWDEKILRDQKFPVKVGEILDEPAGIDPER